MQISAHHFRRFTSSFSRTQSSSQNRLSTLSRYIQLSGWNIADSWKGGCYLAQPSLIQFFHSKRIIIFIVCIIFAGRLWRISFLFLATFPFDLAAFPMCTIMAQTFKHAVSKEDSDGSDPNLLERAALLGVVSIPVALAIIGRKMEFYRSQLGLPEKDSDEFKMLKPEFQKRMTMFYQKEDENFWMKCFANLTKPIDPRSLQPFILLSPLDSATKSLNYLLDEMQRLSLDLLDDATSKKEEKEHVPSETE